jgi:hypothetical protein
MKYFHSLQIPQLPKEPGTPPEMDLGLPPERRLQPGRVPDLPPALHRVGLRPRPEERAPQFAAPDFAETGIRSDAESGAEHSSFEDGELF